LAFEGIVERGRCGVDGGDGFGIAGACLRQASGKTEDEDKQGCSQGYAPLPLIMLPGADDARSTGEEQSPPLN